MFKSAFAAGIAWGLGITGLWLVPMTFAHLTGTGIVGYGSGVAVLLVAAAVIAEIRARRKSP